MPTRRRLHRLRLHRCPCQHGGLGMSTRPYARPRPRHWSPTLLLPGCPHAIRHQQHCGPARHRRGQAPPSTLPSEGCPIFVPSPRAEHTSAAALPTDRLAQSVIAAPSAAICINADTLIGERSSLLHSRPPASPCPGGRLPAPFVVGVDTTGTHLRSQRQSQCTLEPYVRPIRYPPCFCAGWSGSVLLRSLGPGGTYDACTSSEVGDYLAHRGMTRLRLGHAVGRPPDGSPLSTAY